MERSNRLAERRRLGAAALELPRSTMISRSSDDSVWGAVRVVREAVDDMRRRKKRGGSHRDLAGAVNAAAMPESGRQRGPETGRLETPCECAGDGESLCPVWS
jgi:hypothetical protein